MASKQSDSQTLKKLMSIIYEKEKQIDKYKKQLKQKSKQPQGQTNPQLTLTQDEQYYITNQILENKKFLQIASTKLQDMQARIAELEDDLEAEEARNRALEEEVYGLKCGVEDRDRLIVELRTNLELLENAKIHRNTEMGEKERRIQVMEIENAKWKIVSDEMKVENLNLRDRLREIELEINKALKYLQKAMKSKKHVNKSQVDILGGLSRVELHSRQEIKTQTHLDDHLNKGLAHKVSETMETLKAWHQTLLRRQEEWRANFEKDICEQSFDGISQVINDSIMLNNQQTEQKSKVSRSNFYETSMYKKNEQQLLKQLERECEKSEGAASAQKEKLVQLSEVKESLKMTKQVNEQLFDELNRQENIIRVFKETFKTLEQKKLIKNEESEEVRKLKLVLSQRN